MATVLVYIFCTILVVSFIALPIFLWKNDFAKDDEPKAAAQKK